MKNLFLVAAILTAGITSAKTTPVKSLNIKKQKTFKASVKLLKPQVWIAQTDCGWTATTTQDWTPAQANAWLQQLNANYCGGN